MEAEILGLVRAAIRAAVSSMRLPASNVEIEARLGYFLFDTAAAAPAAAAVAGSHGTPSPFRPPATAVGRRLLPIAPLVLGRDSQTSDRYQTHMGVSRELFDALRAACPTLARGMDTTEPCRTEAKSSTVSTLQADPELSIDTNVGGVKVARSETGTLLSLRRKTRIAVVDVALPVTFPCDLRVAVSREEQLPLAKEGQLRGGGDSRQRVKRRQTCVLPAHACRADLTIVTNNLKTDVSMDSPAVTFEAEFEAESSKFDSLEALESSVVQSAHAALRAMELCGGDHSATAKPIHQSAAASEAPRTATPEPAEPTAIVAPLAAT